MHCYDFKFATANYMALHKKQTLLIPESLSVEHKNCLYNGSMDSYRDISSQNYFLK